MSEIEEKLERMAGSKTKLQHMCSWPVVGAVSLFILGGGIAFMLSNHAWVADGFFIAGTVLLLSKFWTWEGTQQQTPKREAAILAMATVLSLILLLGVCVWNHSINPSNPKPARNREVASNQAAPKTDDHNPAAPPLVSMAPSVTSKPVVPKVSVSPRVKLPPKEQKPDTSSSAPIPALATQNPQPAPTPTYSQQCVGCAQAQGPGAKATYTQIGARDWETMLDGEKQKTLIQDLQQIKGKYRLEWSYSDAGGMKMAAFLNYAFLQAKWTPNQIANYAQSICYLSDEFDCSGMLVRVKNKNSDVSKAAIKALSAFVPSEIQVRELDTVPDDQVNILITKAK